MKKKFRGQPKLDDAAGQVQFGCQRNFLNPIISKLDKHVVLLLINYIARVVIQLCKESYSNCLWRKTDWALDLPKLGKASKISGDLRRSPDIVTLSHCHIVIVFGNLRVIFGSFRAIFGSTQVIFENLRRCSGDIRKSWEVFGRSLEVWNCSVIFGNLRECSRDLRKSPGVFGWSLEIFGTFRLAFDNLRKVNNLISLAETNCLIFSQIGQFLRFYSKSLLKTVQIKSQIGQFSEIKG